MNKLSPIDVLRRYFLLLSILHAGCLNIKIPSCQYRIPIIKIRRSDDRLIFKMEILMPGKMVFILRRGPAHLIERSMGYRRWPHSHQTLLETCPYSPHRICGMSLPWILTAEIGSPNDSGYQCMEWSGCHSDAGTRFSSSMLHCQGPLV